MKVERITIGLQTVLSNSLEIKKSLDPTLLNFFYSVKYYIFKYWLQPTLKIYFDAFPKVKEVWSRYIGTSPVNRNL